MTNDDLNRLLRAVETGDRSYYHGDTKVATVEALKELREARETLEDLRGVLDQTNG